MKKNIWKIIIGLFFLVTVIHVISAPKTTCAAACPRNACTNNCDVTRTECVPDANGNPRPCTAADQGWWCISPLRCDPGLPGKVEQRVFFCDGTKWLDRGTETPASDCANFCGGPSPTPDASGIACKDRPFRVWFQSTRRLGPGEQVTCEVNQTSTTCEPCQGLAKHTQCSFGTTFEYCATAESDCLCKHPAYTYSCKLNGVSFTGSSGNVPDPINAQTSYIGINPPGGSVLECKIGNSCSNCNGNPNQCFPDCGGGVCRNNVCISCPAGQPPACTVGQSCINKCNGGDNEKCYPGCNGGVCNAAGKCDSCFESGYVPPPTPTPVQVKTAITIAPTFSPVGNGGAAPQKTQRWVCLETAPCSDPFAKCSGQGDSKHRVAIATGKSSQTIGNRQTYIFECIIGLNGPECTTGNSTTDLKTLQKDMLASLRTTYGYNHQGFFKQNGTDTETNPLLSGSNGEIAKHEWQSTTTQAIGHVFFAMNEVNPNELIGQDSTSKQSTFIMDAIPYAGCIMVTSDPYGRVFDSQTLEPIKGARVTLLQKNTVGTFIKVKNSDVIGGITNPIQTATDGSFSFRVPDGTYKLAVEAKGYTFPAKRETVHENYAKIYSNLYYGDIIIQKGKAVHHDIPLAPVNRETSQNNSALTKSNILAFNQTLTDNKTIIKFEGLVSHPLSTIHVYGKKPKNGTFERTRILTTTISDKNGRFSTSIKAASLGYEETVGDLEVIKEQALYNSEKHISRSVFQSILIFAGSFIENVMGEEKGLISVKKTEPILSVLKGYAVNKTGNRIVNATVEIYLPFSDEAITTVKTDNKGYFSIPSQYLPNIPYSIRYKTITGSVINKTVSEFILDNSL